MNDFIETLGLICLIVAMTALGYAAYNLGYGITSLLLR